MTIPPRLNVDLRQLFEREGTDKIHHAHAYSILLGEKRLNVEAVLEVGIGTMIPGAHSSMVGYGKEGYAPGGSLRAWRDYFPRAAIVGFDVQPDTQFAHEDRIFTFLCDSTDPIQTAHTLEKVGISTFDLIVDDGSHVSGDQLKTLANLFPYLKAKGLYVVEDVVLGSPLCVNPSLMEPVIGRSPYFSIPISGGDEHWHLIIIQKYG